MRRRPAAPVSALIAATLLAIGIAAPAAAGSLRIMPIRVEVAADARFCSLTITNDDVTPVSVQVRGYAWSKDAAGADVLSEDAGFQVNPTIVTLGAGQNRLVRCGLPPAREVGGPGGEPSGGTGGAEESWRMVLDELPRPGPANGGIRTLLRISVPVFRTPADARPDLVWSIGDAPGAGPLSSGSAGPVLVIENRGQRHAQVLSLELTARPGSGRASGGGSGAVIKRSFYVLAGGRMEVALPAGFAGAPESVRATTPDGPLDLRSRAGP
ncbi:fimbria/pilus periplasmic chaperone [Novosphingobium sp. BL-8H]|uniref:fimbrial biogenesis chaperone n=1 Tax=Novosphingobium sp. BL-8H TaxID=3127640 RepID=UPI0037571685